LRRAVDQNITGIGHLSATKGSKGDASLWTGWVTVAGGRMVGVALLLVMQVMLARLLVDPAAYGVFVWATSLAQFGAVVALLGMNSLTVRYGAQYLAEARFGDMGLLLRTVARVALAGSVAMMLLMVGWALLAGSTEGGERQVLLAAALSLPLLAGSSLATALAQSHRWYGLAFFPERTWRPALMILACAAFFLWQGAFPVAAAGWLFLLTTLLWTGWQAGLVWIRYRRSEGGRPSAAPNAPRSELLRDWRGAVGHLYAASLLGVSLWYIDVIMLGFLTDSHETADYFAANRIAQLAGLPFIAMSGVLAPQIAALAGTSSTAELQALVRRGAHIMLWPSCLLGAFLLLLADPLLGLFGAAYTGSGMLLAVLVIGQLIPALAGCSGVMLSMSGHQQYSFRALALAVAVNVFGNIVLVPFLGAMGAALATTVASLLLHGLLYRYAVTVMAIRPAVFSRV